VRWLHGRWRRDVSLLAVGALSDAEQAATERHVASCASCAADLAALRSTLAVAAAGEACAAEPPVALEWLRARVHARLDAAAAAPRRRARRAAWAAGLASAAAVVAATILSRPGPPPSPSPTVAQAVAEPEIAVSDEALERMERTMARERTARYLDEAQDVLVTVSGAPRRCDRKARHIDLADETRRSRELLARRARLDLDGSAALSAGPVLDDVEKVLREVASLENCARRRDVEAIHRHVERERLLMKMELMTRELAG
jgi:putative zinc finger protein